MQLTSRSSLAIPKRLFLNIENTGPTQFRENKSLKIFLIVLIFGNKNFQTKSEKTSKGMSTHQSSHRAFKLPLLSEIPEAMGLIKKLQSSCPNS